MAVTGHRTLTGSIRSALRYVYLCCAMGLQQLEGRRMRSDLMQTFKIVNRKYDINPELFFQLDEGDRRDMTINCSRKDLD